MNLGDEEFSVVMEKIERLMKEGLPLPPELHERALRLQLSRFPDDTNCIRSLVTIFHQSGRPPFPDSNILSAFDSWHPPDASNEGLQELLQSAEKHAAAAQVWESYACLWQAVVRYPGSARPWIEYARYLVDAGEWESAEAALQRASEHQPTDDSDAAAALSTVMLEVSDRKLVALLAKDGAALPADLHERVLRRELSRYPDDSSCIRSLIAILHSSSRVPIPDQELLEVAAGWRTRTFGERSASADVEALIQRARQHAAAAEVWESYTCLWQAIVRHPGSARPWIEYARYLVDAGEWESAEAAVQRASEHQPTDDPDAAAALSAVMLAMSDRKQVALLTKDGAALPADLHERVLRRELSRYPDDSSCIRSLIAILHSSSRVPIPDQELLDAAARWRTRTFEERSASEDVEALIQRARQHAAAAEVWESYTCLWQAVVRNPASMRPWAEFAHAFVEHGEWTFAKTAAERAFAQPQALDPEVARVLLKALAMLAEEKYIDGINWRPWFTALPEELTASSAAVTLLLRVNERAEATERLVGSLAQHPGDFQAWLAASKIAFEEDRAFESYSCLRRALELDFPAALHSVVRNWSGPASYGVHWSGETDRFSDWLEGLSLSYPGANLVPSAVSPEKLATCRRQRAEAIDRGMPPVFFIAQGKSGSASVGNILSSGFTLPTALYSWINLRIVPSWLQDYQRGGACYVTHLEPTKENRTLLVQGGVKEIIVHIRDPRQIALSFVHHINNYPAYASPEWIAKHQEGPEATMDFATDQLAHEAIDWIEGWHRAQADLTVHFTTFESFVTDRDAFCERLLSLYGGDTRFFDRTAAFAHQPNRDYHVRRGEIDEWRRVLTPRQINRINDMIPDHFWKAFNWSP